MEEHGDGLARSRQVSESDYAILLEKLKICELEPDIEECVHLYKNILLDISESELEIHASPKNFEGNFKSTTNLVILACKYNNNKLLKYVLSHSPIEDSIRKGETMPSDTDSHQHNAFYYAMRCESSAILKTLVEDWPEQYFTRSPEELDRVLSDAYRDLKIRNVPLTNEVLIFVRKQLVQLRFFDKNSRSRKSVKDVDAVYDRICFVIEQIEFLETEFADGNVNEIFLLVIKTIAKCIFVLKRQLPETYDRIPWEELEFYLSVYILSIEKPQNEINVYNGHILTANKIFHILKNFKTSLTGIKTQKNLLQKKSLPKLKREEIIDAVIAKEVFSREFYENFYQLRDFYSLGIIESYLLIKNLGDPKEKEGRYLIIRALQVIGENLKNTVKSPKMSPQSTKKILQSAISEHTADFLKSLRDSFSHKESLEARQKVEGYTSELFSQVQKDLQKLITAVRKASINLKYSCLCSIFRALQQCKTIKEMKDLVQTVSLQSLRENNCFHYNYREELEELKSMFEEMKGKISCEKDESYFLEDINRIIQEESTLFDSFNSLNNFKLRVDTIIEEIKHQKYELDLMKKRIKDHFPEFENHSFRENMERINFIYKTNLARFKFSTDDKEIRNITEKISDMLNFQIRWVNGIKICESYFKSLALKKSISSSHQESGNLLQEKIVFLKEILLESFGKESVKNVTFYCKNERTRAILEVLVQDIMSLLSYNKLSDNPYFLDNNCPIVLGKNLRNHLAHDNILVSVLCDTKLDLLLTALEIVKYDYLTLSRGAKLDQVVPNDLSLLSKTFYLNIQTLSKQQKLFQAVSMGTEADVENCVNLGADLLGKRISIQTTLFFAVKASCMEVIRHLASNESVDKQRKGCNVLHDACRTGGLLMVKYLMDLIKMNVDSVNDEGKSPLHIAAENGHVDIVAFLLEKNARTDIKDLIGRAPLHYAVAHNNIAVVEMFLNKDTGIDTCETKDGYTALHVAAENGHSGLVSRLIEMKAEVNLGSNEGKTPLHLASMNGHSLVVEALIEAGARVEALDSYFRTPLHYSALSKDISTVEVLLESNADINIYDIYLDTPLAFAVSELDCSTASLLLKRGAVLSFCEFPFGRVMNIVKSPELIELLLQKSANLRHSNPLGETPLHLSAIIGDEKTIEALLRGGVDIDVKTIYGVTALMNASLFSNKGSCKALIAAGADINARNVNNETALHYSACNGDLDLVELLVSKNADINARDKRGNTPVLNCISKGHKNVLEFLINVGAEIPEGALHASCNAENFEIVDFLLNKNVCIDEKTWGITSLHAAVFSNNVKLVNHLISKGANSEEKDENGKSALYHAIWNNFYDIVYILTPGREDIKIELLYKVIYNGHYEVLNILLKRYNIKALFQYPFIHLSTIKGHRRITSLLIKMGADVNARNKNGLTPLFYAARLGDQCHVSLLIDKGAELNIRKQYEDQRHYTKPSSSLPMWEELNSFSDLLLEGFSFFDLEENIYPLHLAMFYGHMHIIEMLYDRGIKEEERENFLLFAYQCCDVNVVKFFLRKGITIPEYKIYEPIQLLASNDRVDTVDFFIKLGIPVDVTDPKGRTPLHYAARSNRRELVMQLIEKGAKINTVSATGSTPVLEATESGSFDALQELLKHGAIIERYILKFASEENVRRLLENTFKLLEAVRKEDPRGVQHFLELGGLVNAKIGTGMSPLHLASKNGKSDMVRMLLLQGADVNSISETGATPLHLASRKNHYETVLTLLSNGAIYNAKWGEKTVLGSSPKRTKTYELVSMIDELFQKVQNGDFRSFKNLLQKAPIVLKSVFRTQNCQMECLTVVAIKAHITGNETSTPHTVGILQDDILCEYLEVKKDLGKNVEKSRSILEEFLKKRLEIFSSDDLSILEIEETIAELLMEEKKYDEALNMLHNIRSRRKTILKHDNFNILTNKNIVMALYELGRLKECYKTIEEVLDIFNQLNSSDFYLIWLFKMMKVNCWNDLGYKKKALNLISEMVDELKRTSRYDLYINSLEVYANLQNSVGKDFDTLHMLKEVYEFRKTELGEFNEYTISALYRIMRVLLSLENYDEALRVAQSIADIKQTVKGKEHIDTLKAQNDLSRCLYLSGKRMESYALQHIVLNPLMAILGNQHAVVTDIRDMMEKIETRYRYVRHHGKSILYENIVFNKEFEGISRGSLKEIGITELNKRLKRENFIAPFCSCKR